MQKIRKEKKMKYEFIKREQLKEKPTEDLGFGQYFTDYMFEMTYSKEKGWHDKKIRPYGSIEVDPSVMVLHYAQETFEGLKAYRKGDDVYLFRPEMNGKRFQNSNERMCMPKVDVDEFVEIIETIVDLERDWIPQAEGESLYIRPLMFASEINLAVQAANKYTFLVSLSPVGQYYKEGINPVKIYVEDQYIRAAQGGTGFVKCGGNYAASLIAQQRAEDLGYSQVLWLDGKERKYVEEVGSMNAMFLVDDTIYTAPIDGTVLPGVTRDSVIKLLDEFDIKVKEEHFTIDFLLGMIEAGRLKEAFGTGTAAVISPIGELGYKGKSYVINDFKTGDLTKKLYDRLTGIQYGKEEDTYGWRRKVKNDNSEIE